MARIQTTPDSIDRLLNGALDEAAELCGDSRSRSGGMGGSSVGSGEVGSSHGERLASPARPRVESFPGYQVLKEIRSGGQAVVYLGVQDATEQRVAIKVFRPAAALTLKERYRFETEVESLRELQHPGIVRILDSDATRDRPYIVMEYVPGWNLDEYFRENSLDVRATMRLFKAIVEAIGAAHQKGIIHRDIKPGNIRIDHNGEAHVFDFGLAKSSSAPAADVTVTKEGQFLGTLYWVSPEQAEGRAKDVDVRTDVYSLGAVLFNMLTGEVPFETGGSIRDVLNRIVTAEPKRPRGLRKEIDDDVETIVLKCLEKEPGRRYATAEMLAEDVERWLEGRAIEAKRESWGYVARKFAKKHRAILVCAGVIGSALCAVLYMAATMSAERAAVRAERASMRELDEQLFNGGLADVDTFVLNANQPLNKEEEREAYVKAVVRLDDFGDRLGIYGVRLRCGVAGACGIRGMRAEALKQQYVALTVAERMAGSNSHAVLTCLANLPGLLTHAGLLAEAKPMAVHALSLAEKLSAAGDTRLLIAARSSLIDVLFRLNEFDAAAFHLRANVRMAREHPNRRDGASADTLKTAGEYFFDMGSILRSEGKESSSWFKESLDYRREGLERAEAAYRDNPWRLAHHVHSLSVHFRNTGALDEAARLGAQAVSLRSTIPDDHPESVYRCASFGNLGVIRMRQGCFPQSEVLLLEAVYQLKSGPQITVADLRKEFSKRLAELHSMWALIAPREGHAEQASWWLARSNSE